MIYYQADHPPVPDPMLDETDQPFPADRIEKASDVGIEYCPTPCLGAFWTPFS
jgi:hypothetical protein